MKVIYCDKLKAVFLAIFLIFTAGLVSECSENAANTVFEPNSNPESPVSIWQTTSAATLSLTESATVKYWTGISGNDVADLKLVSVPQFTSTTLKSSLIVVAEMANEIMEYITAPVTGINTLWIAGGGLAELWLSASTDATKAVEIASFLSWTSLRQWSKFSSEESVISLKTGSRYCIKVLNKSPGGNGCVSVRSRFRDKINQIPIFGSVSSLYTNPSAVVAKYTASKPLTYTNAHDITISGKSIAGGATPCINLINCYNIIIKHNKLCNSTDVGIHIYKSYNITVKSNYFTEVSTGVYAEQTTAGGIVIDDNTFLNMVGPFPRGQFVQFNNVSGPGCSISQNKGQNIFGQSFPEDAISLYQSSGTAASPILIDANSIRGGGPSSSGGGIMLGDNGGSYLTASNNILVDPGEYGMAIAGGSFNSLINNKIYGSSQYFTNVGLYVNSINGYTVSASIVMGNQVLFYNSNKYANPCWLAPGVAKPAGWDTANTWGAKITSAILPTKLVSNE